MKYKLQLKLTAITNGNIMTLFNQQTNGATRTSYHRALTPMWVSDRISDLIRNNGATIWMATANELTTLELLAGMKFDNQPTFISAMSLWTNNKCVKHGVTWRDIIRYEYEQMYRAYRVLNSLNDYDQNALDILLVNNDRNIIAKFALDSINNRS